MLGETEVMTPAMMIHAITTIETPRQDAALDAMKLNNMQLP